MSRVAVLGGGGREAALAWKLLQSREVESLIGVPGNPSFQYLHADKLIECWQFPLESQTDFQKLGQKLLSEKVDLVVVGPDALLEKGVVDALQALGLEVFGPTKAAAKIEWSKSFAKEVMSAAGVPTARSQVVTSMRELDLHAFSSPPVVKADGLALGKGVVVATSNEEATHAAGEFLKQFASVLLEERLEGEEISWFALCDGQDFRLLEPARDYKRVFDGNRGPNTGGMGAVSPVSWALSLEPIVRERVFAPMLKELASRGTPFRGLLYAGLMVDRASSRVWVLEFNARFGDPETQAAIGRLDADLFEILRACAKGDLSKIPPVLPHSREAHVFVVAASAGYPGAPQAGKEIESPLFLADRCRETLSEPKVFIAAARRVSQNTWQSMGGRVLGVLGRGADVAQAREMAYERLRSIDFEGMQFRSDIGKELTR